MTTSVANVVQGTPLTTGGALIGTAGATLPTDASASLSGFTALGYVSDAGLTEAIGRTTDKVKAWGGDVVKVVQSEFSVTYQLTLFETLNSDVLKAAFGSANVTTTAATSSSGTKQAVKINSSLLEKLPWIFDMKDGNTKIRVVVPIGQATLTGDIVYTNTGVTGYPLTIEAFKDSSGNQAYHYTDDGVFSA